MIKRWQNQDNIPNERKLPKFPFFLMTSLYHYKVCRQKANKVGVSLMVAALVYHKSSHGAVYTMQLLLMPAALFRSFSTRMVAYCISAVSTPIDTQMERSWAKFFILLLSFLSFYPIIFLLYWILAPVFVLIIHHICHFFYISHKQDFLIPNFNTKELQNLNRQWVCHSFRFWR